MGSRRLASVLLMVAAAWASSPAAVAQQLDPEKVKLAAEEYDAGRRAYKSGDYERAAAHFENAFRDAPNAAALRMAIWSRKQAGDLARSATLCVRAQALYPDDEPTMDMAQRVLRETAKKLQKVTVDCEPACTLVLDGRVVRDDATARQVIFAAPGPHTLVAGWGKQRSESQQLEAQEGGDTTMRFEAPPEPPAPPPKPAPAAQAASDANRDKGVESKAEGLSPVFFWVGTGVTAALVGATVWSGLDTRSNPGPDAVREACVGLGESCPTYQDGLSHERRTNYLLAGSVVAGVATGVVGLFFTDWSSNPAPERAAKAARLPQLVPAVGVGAVGVHATGSF